MGKVIVLTLVSVSLSIAASLLVSRLTMLRRAHRLDERLDQWIPEAELAGILEGGL